MLNDAAKYGVGVTVFALLAAAGSRMASGDRAGALLLVGAALVAAILSFGAARTLGADLPPFVAADAAAATPIDPNEAARASGAPIALAFGVTITAIGGAINATFLLAGGLITAAAAVAWFVGNLRTETAVDPRDAANVDTRLIGPVALPVGAFLLTVTLAFSFSRVLLAIPKTASWVLAFIVAALTLTALTLIANRRPATRAVVSVAAAGFVATVLAGGAFADVGPRTIERERDPTPVAFLTAHQISFDRKVVTLPANSNVEVVFRNEDDATYHNVAFYTEDVPGRPIFAGKPIPGVREAIYTLHTPAAGTYRFVCDFHPTMLGSLHISATPGAPAEKGSSK